MSRKTPPITLPGAAKKKPDLDDAEVRRFIQGEPDEPSGLEAPPPRADAASVHLEAPEQHPASRPQYPWESVGAAPQFKGIRIPEREHMMLRWIAGTTYDLSQNALILEALRKEIEFRMRERGFRVSRDSEGGIVIEEHPQR